MFDTLWTAQQKTSTVLWQKLFGNIVIWHFCTVVVYATPPDSGGIVGCSFWPRFCAQFCYINIFLLLPFIWNPFQSSVFSIHSPYPLSPHHILNYLCLWGTLTGLSNCGLRSRWKHQDKWCSKERVRWGGQLPLVAKIRECQFLSLKISFHKCQ